jgi:hypothetical protein
MNKRIILIVLVCLTLLVNIVIAAEGDPQQEFDYTNDDYTNINWATFTDWNKIPPERIVEIPAEMLDYTQLNSAQRMQMSTIQIISNFDNIDDLTTDVDPEKAIEAINEKFGLTITQLSSGINVKNGILSSLTDLNHRATLEDYNGWEMRVESNGEIILIPPEGKIFVVNDKDSLIVDTNSKIINYQGNSILGMVGFDRGYAYSVGQGNIFNGVKIIPENLDERIYLHFDGEHHAGGYISFDLSNGKFAFGNYIEGNDFELKFTEESPFFDVEPEDQLIINSGFGFDFTIQTRTDLIPLLKVQQRDESGKDAHINNGGNIFHFEENGFTLYNYINVDDGDVSVPFTVLLQDKNGDDLLGNTEKNHKLVMDNSGNFVVIDSSYPLEVFECIKCVEDLKQSGSVYQFAFKRILEISSISGISMSGDVFSVVKLMEQLEQLPSAIRNSLERISFHSRDELDVVCGENAAGCIYRETKSIHFLNDFDFPTLYHEGAHALHYTLDNPVSTEKEIRELSLRLRREHDFDNLVLDTNENGEFIVVGYRGSEEVQIPVEDQKNYLALNFATRETGAFTKQWSAININGKDDYERNLGPMRGTSLPNRWEDGTYGPKYGFFRAYGANEVEDITTTAEMFADETNMNLARQLINSESDFYLNKMDLPILRTEPNDVMTPEIAQQWAKVYREKIDFLYRHGFITNENYQNVVLRSSVIASN